ncbi:MAG: hypothetical protein KA419_11305 [Acidobacteria bacterium]|nr:hypothetical protein [Acidobacteriota bacterium]
MPTVLKCPSCGASLEADGIKPVVKCGYCGNRVKVGEAPPAPAPPYTATAHRRVAPEPPSPFQQRLTALLRALTAAGMGYLACEVHWSFRTPKSEPLPTALLAGLVALLAVTLGNRLLGALFAAWCGLLLASKPWLSPIPSSLGGTMSPTSETAQYFLVPGILFLVMALLGFLSVRRETVRSLRPLSGTRLLHLLLFAGGVALGIWATTGTTRMDLYAKYRGDFERVRTRLARVAEAIEAGPELPARVSGLSPVPAYDKRSPGSNTAILPFENLRKPDEDPVYELYLSYPYLRCFKLTAPGRREVHKADFLFASGEDEAEIRAVLDTRYLAVYQAVSENPEPGDPPRDRSPWHGGVRVTVWLADLPSGKLLLRVPLPDPADRYDAVRRRILEALRTATGGTFRDQD